MGLLTHPKSCREGMGKIDPPNSLLFCSSISCQDLPLAELKWKHVKGFNWTWRKFLHSRLILYPFFFFVFRVSDFMVDGNLCLFVDYFCGRKEALWKQGLYFGIALVFNNAAWHTLCTHLAFLKQRGKGRNGKRK